MTIIGGLGSLLDSALGGWLQESVVDARTGKVVEGVGGTKVLVQKSTSQTPSQKKTQAQGHGEGPVPSRRVESGVGLLDNNAVNFLMALTMSVGGMVAVGWMWGVEIQSMGL